MECLKNAEAGRVDRPEVVAHATLTGLTQHWPDEPAIQELGLKALLEDTAWIRKAEPGRWLKQRRIGLAKLAEIFNSDQFRST